MIGHDLTPNIESNESGKWQTRRGAGPHPEVFSSTALAAGSAAPARTEWVDDRKSTREREAWANKRLSKEDVVVL
jgi:hypothetical protein